MLLKKRRLLCYTAIGIMAAVVLNSRTTIDKAADSVPIVGVSTGSAVSSTIVTNASDNEVNDIAKVSCENVSTALRVLGLISKEDAKDDEQETYMYVNKYVFVRAQKDLDSDQKFLLKPGNKVLIIEQGKKWSKIKTDKGDGFVRTKNFSDNKKEALKEADNRKQVFKITGYDSCPQCCGVGGGKFTKSGRRPKVNHTVAADLNVFPMYTQIYIEGLGAYTVEDIGGGVKGSHIDVYCHNHKECYAITQKTNVSIIE